MGFHARLLGVSTARVREQTVTVDLLVLSVSGDLDTCTAPLLQHNLSQALPAVTVLDLSRLEFLGVAGLQVLEAAATNAVAERRRIGLVTGSDSVRRIMRLFDLHLRVPVYPLLGDALRELT
ncbi:hypothetical protein B0293_20840 [Amycolatopsis azurea DSM 43854]|uniref:STAS domain-containing protein n=1 Tax=Amycolatopsis azurea DSM 43854 TaxID=1238180 RepID=A0ABX3JB42_9PSEU|nr:hypothetical protein B0293_20840 [Amycolatopsis azurea DSM 43854]